MNLELQKGSRSKILAAIVLGTMAIFVIRLFYLQIINMITMLGWRMILRSND